MIVDAEHKQHSRSSENAGEREKHAPYKSIEQTGVSSLQEPLKPQEAHSVSPFTPAEKQDHKLWLLLLVVLYLTVLGSIMLIQPH